MRKSHTEWKGQIIKQYTSGKCVLDLGSGRMGDLHNYTRAGTLHVDAVDPDIDNLVEGMKRTIQQSITHCNRQLPTIRSIHSMAEDTEKVLRSIGGAGWVDVAASFFSLTFFFGDEKRLIGLLQTVTSALKPGGFWIMTFMDGGATRSLLKNVHTGDSLDTQHYRIDKLYLDGNNESTFSPFGHTICIHFKSNTAIVKEQKEFLVDFDTLIKMAAAVGLQHVEDHFFIPPDQLLDSNLRAFSRCNRSCILYFAQPST